MLLGFELALLIVVTAVDTDDLSVIDVRRKLHRPNLLQEHLPEERIEIAIDLEELPILEAIDEWIHPPPPATPGLLLLALLDDHLIDHGLALIGALDTNKPHGLVSQMPPVHIPTRLRDHPHHGEHIGDHIALDLEVQWAVGVHRGRVVDLDQPGF